MMLFRRKGRTAPEPSMVLLRLVLGHLNEGELFYAVVGDMAMRMRGLEASPASVDLVVNITRKDREAIARRARRELKHVQFLGEDMEDMLVMEPTGDVPMMLRKARDELDTLTIGRRGTVDHRYMMVYVASPEDMVLREVRTGNGRAVENAINIYRQSRNVMDISYLVQMSRKLDIYEEFIRLKKRADGL